MRGFPSAMNVEYMKHAIALAIENVISGRGGPFACVIVQEGRILAEGTNLVTSERDPTAHAEMIAIRNACRALKSFQLKDCDLYSTCEPCPMCLGAIYCARPAQVFFAANASDAAFAGFDDAFIYSELRRLPGERRIHIEHILRAQSLGINYPW